MAKRLIKSVAHAIRHFRKAQGLSQEELADKACLDRTYISGVERATRNITLESLDQIIFALEVTPANFFDFATKEPSSDLHN